MDYKEQQDQEVEALEAIYPEEELTILENEYPDISVQIDLKSNQEDCENENPDDFVLSLIVDLPETYPDVIPQMRIEGVEDHFSDERIQEVIAELEKIAEENLGMVMVFTIVSALQEEIGKLVDVKKAEANEVVEIAKEIEDAKARKKFEGTVVTQESFIAWKRKFDAERAVLKDKQAKEREALLAGRLTGRQMFLRDATLNLSDMAFVEETANNVEIDESLFDDEELEGLDGLDSEED